MAQPVALGIMSQEKLEAEETGGASAGDEKTLQQHSSLSSPRHVSVAPSLQSTSNLLDQDFSNEKELVINSPQPEPISRKPIPTSPVSTHSPRPSAMEAMDDKSPVSVPPYEANPSQYGQHQQQPGMHHTGSYGSAPGQPMVQHDIYQQPVVSPMTTGGQFPNQTMGSTNQYPHQPVGSPPPEMQQQQQQPKGDYYSPQGQQQMPMQQPQQQQAQMQPMQVQQSQYQTAIPLANLGEASAPADCPVCRHRALTVTQPHSGNTTNAWAGLLCIFLCLGCIPYLLSGLKDIEHKCGHCGVLLATWHRSGRTVVHQHG